MRLVIQRVKQASVSVDSQVVSHIGKGLLVLAGICTEDTLEDCKKAAYKLAKIRLWPNQDGQQWRASVSDIGGEVICVSQFTLYAKVSKGTKPDFHQAAKGEHARELYESFKKSVALEMPNGDKDVKDGQFGAMMDVSLINDGPVTIEYDTKA